MVNIGERIKARRQELGMSAEQLASKIGVSPATIYRYENNDISHMGVDKLPPIAAALATTPGCLMGWEPESWCGKAPAACEGEQELVMLYRSLNQTGRSTVLATVRAMAGNPAMTEENIKSEMA